MNDDAMTAWNALGYTAEIHARGRVELDDTGIHITDPDGRRWNLQHDDPVTIATDTEAAV
jgi:hypothetical protein